MNATLLLTAGLQPGTVARLNFDAGFGYVRGDGGTWIFVAELVTHRLMQQLRVGPGMQFELDGRGRVVRLVPAQSSSPYATARSFG